jgi:hypothetical protein
MHSAPKGIACDLPERVAKELEISTAFFIAKTTWELILLIKKLTYRGLQAYLGYCVTPSNY